jgi:hypothetical protein
LVSDSALVSKTFKSNRKGKTVDTQTFTVQAVWDAEANVWVAESDDVPGLVTEDASQEKLVEKLTSLVPELLELNNHPIDPTKPIEIIVQYRREERISVPVAAQWQATRRASKRYSRVTGAASIGRERAIVRSGLARSTTGNSPSILTSGRVIPPMRS